MVIIVFQLILAIFSVIVGIFLVVIGVKNKKKNITYEKDDIRNDFMLIGIPLIVTGIAVIYDILKSF